jgi:hypothetical protein
MANFVGSRYDVDGLANNDAIVPIAVEPLRNSIDSGKQRRTRDHTTDSAMQVKPNGGVHHGPTYRIKRLPAIVSVHSCSTDTAWN